MANTSILAAFERMWQHVVAALGNKFDKTGGTITGDLQVNNTLKINPSNSLDSDYPIMRIGSVGVSGYYYNGGRESSLTLSNECMAGSSTLVHLDGVAEPRSNDSAANKEYVDNAIYCLKEETKPVIAESTDGITYTATVPWVTELYSGLTITVVPNEASESTSPTLNVNGLGEYRLIHRGGAYGTILEYDIIDGLSWYVPYKLTFYKCNQFGDDENETLSGWIIDDIYLPSKEYISSTMVDYIVEQGTSGDWTYRKWASGIAEVWGRTSGELQGVGVVNDIYHGYLVITMPSVFNDVPTVVNYTLYATNGYDWGGKVVISSATTFNVYVLSQSNLANYTTPTIYAHAVGRWK